MMQLAGTHEAAAIAGISRQRFAILMQQGRVPAPIASLKCGTIWLAADIEAWAAARNRSPGPRKLEADDEQERHEAVSWSKEKAALSFTAYFAELSDEDILEGQWDYEKLSELRQEAIGITEMAD